MNVLKKSLLDCTLVVCMVSLLLAPSSAEIANTSVYLRLVGIVNRYGNEPAMGSLYLAAKNETSAKAHMLFFTPKWWHVLDPFPETGIHIYGFKLLNASVIQIYKSGSHIEGNWIGFHLYWNTPSIRDLVEAIKNLEWIKTKGNLDVTDAYTVFKVSLDSLEPIAGSVVRSRIITITAENIPEGDFNLDGKIDIRDISLPAKAFGSTITDFRYDLQIDVNFDFTVDIRDIAVVCRNFGKSY